jgi:hypothetical protein
MYVTPGSCNQPGRSGLCGTHMGATRRCFAPSLAIPLAARCRLIDVHTPLPNFAHKADRAAWAWGRALQACGQRRLTTQAAAPEFSLIR